MATFVRSRGFECCPGLLQLDESRLHVGLPDLSTQVAGGKRAEDSADENDCFRAVHSEADCTQSRGQSQSATERWLQRPKKRHQVRLLGRSEFRFQHEVEELDRVFQREQSAVVQVRR